MNDNNKDGLNDFTKSNRYLCLCFSSKHVCNYNYPNY